MLISIILSCIVIHDNVQHFKISSQILRAEKRWIFPFFRVLNMLCSRTLSPTPCNMNLIQQYKKRDEKEKAIGVFVWECLKKIHKQLL